MAYDRSDFSQWKANMEDMIFAAAFVAEFNELYRTNPNTVHDRVDEMIDAASAVADAWTAHTEGKMNGK